MSPFLYFAIWGALGGLLRAIGGFSKAKALDPWTKANWIAFLREAFFAAVVGAVIGALVDHSPWTSASFGYAGMDAIQTVFKVRANWLQE